MNDEIFDSVTEVFRDVFDDEDLIITPETNASTIADWDSYNHINLIVAWKRVLKSVLQPRKSDQ